MSTTSTQRKPNPNRNGKKPGNRNPRQGVGGKPVEASVTLNDGDQVSASFTAQGGTHHFRIEMRNGNLIVHSDFALTITGGADAGNGRA